MTAILVRHALRVPKVSMLRQARLDFVFQKRALLDGRMRTLVQRLLALRVGQATTQLQDRSVHVQSALPAQPIMTPIHPHRAWHARLGRMLRLGPLESAHLSFAPKELPTMMHRLLRHAYPVPRVPMCQLVL